MPHFKLLHQGASAEAAGVARIVVFGFWLYQLARTRLEALADMPVGFFDTYGFMRLFGDPASYLQYPALLGLRIVAMLLVIAALLGCRPYPLVAFAACISITLFDGTLKGFGTYINHAQMGMLYAAYILAFMPAADGLSACRRRIKKPRGAEYSLTLISIPFVLCCAYAFVAARRLASGGLGVFVDDSVISWFATRSLNANFYGFDLGLLFSQHPALATLLKLSFFLITIFELLSPLCLIHRGFRLVWLIVIVPFHFLSLLMMNIFFWENLILIAAFLTNFPHLATRKPATGGLPVLFYDGTCGLSHAFVRWLVKHDSGAIIHFASLQRSTSKEFIGAPDGNRPEDWGGVFRDEDGIWKGSDAFIRAIARLGGLWGFAKLVLVTPRFLRECAYRWVGIRCVRSFGTKPHSQLPAPEEPQRFRT